MLASPRERIITPFSSSFCCGFVISPLLSTLGRGRYTSWGCAEWLRTMAGMDVKLPRKRSGAPSPRDGIVQRLARVGVPQAYLDDLELGLIAFVRENKSLLRDIVSAILPTDAQVRPSKKESEEGQRSTKMKVLFEESLVLLQWLMFEGDPEESLNNLAQKAAGQRAVCGTVWGHNELAYRCRTCGHDPTCAICVPCFQNGDHKDHDFSIIYTGGGCCDCGDVTAWKREGFCLKHKGTEQIEPLPNELASSMGPVVEALFSCWREKLLSVQIPRHPTERDPINISVRFAHELSSSVVDMLLGFSNCNESLLSFVSKRMYECINLLDVLVKAERFLDEKVVKKLREMLLKFLGEPLFKYEFAKVLIRYYPTIVREVITESSGLMEKYSLISTFSVQIFTVPTLTPRLVREVDLLGVLLGCLWDLFLSCVAEDGHLQASKLANLLDFPFRLVEDIRYAMSHDEVSRYVACERPDILRTWIGLLALVQGMDKQKRVTGLPVEEENETLDLPFLMGHYLGNVNTLLAEGAFSVGESMEMSDKGLDESDKPRHAKVGPQDMGPKNVFTYSSKYSGMSFDRANCCSIPLSMIWLIFECLKAIDNWVGSDTPTRGDSFSRNATWSTDSSILTLRKKLFRIKKGRDSIMFYRTLMSREDTDDRWVSATSEHRDSPSSSPIHGTDYSMGMKGRDLGGEDNNSININITADMYAGPACMSGLVDDSLMEGDSDMELEALKILSLAEWPKIAYDVSSQEISFHIPLHRFLSLLLRKAIQSCCGEIDPAEKARGIPYHVFFGHVLVDCHPFGFASYVMEHPLRLRVFCALVRAGMWRRNGNAAIITYELYHSLNWFEEGLESDLFLLQCCAALAPPDLFVERIQERFGLSNYISLTLSEHNEYEPVLVQDMLTLIIQIVKERRFCGFSTIDNLQRELIHRLASGDATHSQLMKALPRDLSKSDLLQDVLKRLTVYSNPSGMKQGIYSLQRAYWKELDLYHPRWNYRDLHVAEERYLQFCKVPASNVQLPRWTTIFRPLATVSRIATSKSVILIVRAVLFYAISAEEPSVSHAPEGVLITALHLLSLALDICDKNEVCINEISSDVDPSQCEGQLNVDTSSDVNNLYPILTHACEEFDVDPTDASFFWKRQSILSLLVSLMKKLKEEKNDSNYSEMGQSDISSLIEHLLKKFAKLSADCMTELERLVPDAVSRMNEQTCIAMVNNLPSSSDVEERRAKVRERQAAIMEKMKAEQSKFIASLKASANEEPDVLKPEQDVSTPESDHVLEEFKPLCSLCRDSDSQSPLCYLVLLQKSRLTTFVERGPPSWEDIVRSDKEIQTMRKEGIVNPSGADSSSPEDLVQSEFAYDIGPAEIAAFLDCIKVQLPDIRSMQNLNVSNDRSRDTTLSLEMMEDDIYHSIQVDLHNLEFHVDAMASHQCSISHDTIGSKKNKSKESSVFGECIASLSRQISKQHQSCIYGFLDVANASSKFTSSSAKSNSFGPIGCDGIHISSCGHAVHHECHDRYLLSLKRRYSLGLGFEGHIVDPDLGEFLCPVCRRLANSILPVLPGVSNKSWRQMMPSGSGSTSPLISSPLSDSHNKFLRVSHAFSLLKSAAKMVGQDRYLKSFSRKPSENFEPAVGPILHKLRTLNYPHIHASLVASGRLSHSLMLWNTLRYSLISAEIVACGRSNAGLVGSNTYVESLYGELQSSNGFILLLLLRVCQTNRCLNSLEVLMRFRGIQLFAGSICYGVSGDNNFLKTDRQRGTISSILEDADNEDIFPGIQFWKRAADPILAHDPFSSLMWVLFCLPLPFLSSSESFIPLVHLFYVVSVVQALITCYHSTKDFDISCFGNCLLNDVCKTMEESGVAHQYFVSNYIDCSCHPKEMIRRLTFPYLRRCALLWKLIKSSKLAPFCDSSEKLEESNLSIKNDTSDAVNWLSVELNNIRELEDLFQVHSLEMVLKDELVHTLALRWCEHFCEEFKLRNYGDVLYSTPAVPLKLMQLPQVYQDLLQRYAKLQCSHCQSVPEQPALCLLCGKLCSSRWKQCCSASKCLNHAMVCGAGVGVFLLVKRTTILLQRSVRQALWPSPYLDAFGEEDPDMGRGKPLYLNEERYTALTNLVASHGLDHSSRVLRQTTITLYGSD